MATLTVRDLDDTLKAKLRVRAAEHGRSMEAEVRAILRSALTSPATGLGSLIQRRFTDVGDISIPVPARTEVPRVAELPE
jgi:plasmid stability protein